ncbi:hypothetical protein bcgnr5380_35610 [Bacillus cereus]
MHDEAYNEHVIFSYMFDSPLKLAYSRLVSFFSTNRKEITSSACVIHVYVQERNVVLVS